MIDILKALAEETRLRIFAQIIKGDMCVCEIEECLELTQSNASRHLTALKRAGILDSYKTAQWAYYKVSDTFITENKELYNYLIQKRKNLKLLNQTVKNTINANQLICVLVKRIVRRIYNE